MDDDSLKRLIKLSPDKLRELASPAVFERGETYCRENRVLAWDASGDSLKAYVAGSGSNIYTIGLTVFFGEILLSCNCPAWNRTDLCKHVVSVVLTLRSVLSQEALNAHQLDLRKTLESGVAVPTPVAPKTVTLRLKDTWTDRNSVFVEFLYRDKPAPSTVFDVLLDPEARPLARFQLSRLRARQLEVFCRLLEKTRGALRFEYSSRDETVLPLEYDPGFACEERLGLDSKRDGKVACVRELWRAGSPVGDDSYRIGRALFAADTGRFGPISGEARVDAMANTILEALFGPADEADEGYRYPLFGDESAQTETLTPARLPVLTIGSDRFSKSLLLKFPPDARDAFERLVVFREDGGIVRPEPAALSYSIEIRRAEDASSVTMNPTVSIDEPSIILSHIFPDLLEQTDELILPRQTGKKRRERLVLGLLGLLLIDKATERTEALERILADPLFDTRKKRIVAKRFLKRLSGGLRKSRKEARVFLHEGHWIEAAFDFLKAGRLYAVLAAAGLPVSLADGIGGRAASSFAELRQALPRLAPLAGRFGLELRYEGRPLVFSELVIDLAVRETDRIDWFELHPSVGYSGGLIRTKDWASIINGEPLVADDGSVVVFGTEDSDTLRILDRLMGVKKAEPVPCVSRLAVFDWFALRRKGLRISLPPEAETIFRALLALTGLPAKRLPSGFVGTLRPYQKTGYDWLCFLYENRFGACLADDMGLGKTVQAAAFLLSLKPKRGESKAPQLVVVPPSLLFNWQSELARFAPALTVHEYTGQARELKDADVVLTTYGILQRDAEKLSSRDFDVVVFDEAQLVKNIKAGRTGAARGLKRRFTLCLTGTPMENRLDEYYSILDLALPGLLGTPGEFKRATRDNDVTAIRAKSRPFVLRRTKEAILGELPPKTESNIFLEMTPLQKEIYTRTVAEVRKEIADAYRLKPQAQAGIIALTALLRLRQTCVSPRIVHPDFAELSPKLDYLSEKLKELRDEDHGVLVFSQFVSVLSLIRDVLDREGIPYLSMDGSTPAAARKKLVAGFQDGSAPGVFLLSLKTGGVGLNLTRASYVFHVDPWWNPAVEDQASDRTHRIGQEKPVFVQRILMLHSIEEKMIVLKQKKRALFDSLMSGTDAAASKGLSREDFEFLIGEEGGR